MARSNRSRKNRRASRKNRSNRRSRRNMNGPFRVANGGSYSVKDISPMDLNDSSMMSPQRLSVAQGQQFGDLTKNMHGGMGVYPGAVVDSALPQNLHASARLVALDRSYNEIAGMQDGGRRRRKGRKASRKGRKASRKSRKGRKASRKSRKGRKSSRKSRKSRRQRGGYAALGFASTDSPGMLLDASQTARAGLNPEWKLAENPNSFSPQ